MTQNIVSYIIKGLLHWYGGILSLVGISTDAPKLVISKKKKIQQYFVISKTLPDFVISSENRSCDIKK